MKAFHAFLISHIIYAAPFLKLKKMELNKIDALIRTGVKRVLNLPKSTNTDRLLQLGLHNTATELFEAQRTKRVLNLPKSTNTDRLLQLGLHNTATELFEAQRTAQICRLSLTKAGTRILLEAGLQPLFMPPEKDKISSGIRGAICVDPIPRNIHPVHNEGRRRARAEAILGKIERSSSTTFFVDAAKYWKKDAYVVTVVDAKGSLVNAATVVTGFTHEAEEMAIAVALQERIRGVTIFSDSRTAIRSFSSGLVSTAAASIVNKMTTEAIEGEDPLTHIIWFPAHMGNISSSPTGNPNERAHQLARELATRGGDRPSRTGSEGGCIDFKDPLISFHEITSAHKLGRRIFPPPHPKLNKAQAVTLRQLQTKTYITPAMLNKIDPDFSPHCQHCNHGHCNFEHMLWLCPFNSGSGLQDKPSWEAAIRSPELSNQLLAVQRARDIAERLQLPAPSWVEPPG
uniref:Putative tick transposon n=1 Tax=Rhipicephalus pulchellus TaxID=72859 RepID=L7LSY9_RHIPC